VGRLVRTAEERGQELHQLPPSAFADAHPLFGKDAVLALDPNRSIAQREIQGGTGPDAVREQLVAAHRALAGRTATEARGSERIGAEKRGDS
jgi:argininosuccinate lyase